MHLRNAQFGSSKEKGTISGRLIDGLAGIVSMTERPLTEQKRETVVSPGGRSVGRLQYSSSSSSVPDT